MTNKNAVWNSLYFCLDYSTQLQWMGSMKVSSVDIMSFNNKMSDDNKLRENTGEKSKLIFVTKSFQAALIPEMQKTKGTDIIRGSFS